MSSHNLQRNTRYMTQALALAEKGRPWTSPNPLVGCVIVKENRVVSTGYHARFGAPHAEVVALREAGRKARGATLYVTLEPCCTFGKTPPCTAAILASGVKHVVIGAVDPNPKHRGRGVRLLRRAGLTVTVGLLRQAVAKQNETFFTWMTQQRPFIILKLAQSLDGKIATRAGDSKWISGPASRHLVHQLRHAADAVCVGTNTAVMDNPWLTARNNGTRLKQPIKVVLDRTGRIPKTHRLFQGTAPIIITNLKQGLRELAKRGISSLLVEGGGEVAASLLAQGVVDQLYLFVSPKIVGGRDAKTSVEGAGARRIRQALQLRSMNVERIGEDLLITGRPH